MRISGATLHALKEGGEARHVMLKHNVKNVLKTVLTYIIVCFINILLTLASCQRKDQINQINLVL